MSVLLSRVYYAVHTVRIPRCTKLTLPPSSPQFSYCHHNLQILSMPECHWTHTVEVSIFGSKYSLVKLWLHNLAENHHLSIGNNGPAFHSVVLMCVFEGIGDQL